MKTIVAFFRRHFPAGLRTRIPRDISVISISPARSRSLNRRYRGLRKAANVLSFRYGDEYGEILISPAVIRREAAASGLPARFETARMILHAMIHLAGIHHEASAGAGAKTQKIEKDLMNTFSQRRRGVRARRNA